MNRRILALLMTGFCLFGGWGQGAAADAQKHTLYFFDTFDTMITLIGYTEDQATFDRAAEQAKQRFIGLHQLFDAYHEYEGIHNIYTLNRDAHIAPVSVAPELMALLVFAKEWQPKLLDTVNIAMGSVLQLWHDYRTMGAAEAQSATLPSVEELKAAALETDFDSVVLNEDESTVFFLELGVQLDVGAVAKGYATELVAQMLLSSEMPHFILNAGGNVRAGQRPLDDRARWGVGIQDPEAVLAQTANESSLEVLYLTNLSVVSSGDYERFYMVDGMRYHHIISPQTLMPATENRAVTIVCEDSAVADILSTAVFILPYEEGLALVESLDGVEALWVRADGEVLMTDGLRQMSKSGGATAYEE